MGRGRAVIASYVGVLVYASVIFLAAWRLLYWQALLYVAVAVTVLSGLDFFFGLRRQMALHAGGDA